MFKGTGPSHTIPVDPATNRHSGWSHNAAGRVVNDGNTRYAYDANNQISSLIDDGITYGYDTGARRVVKATGTEIIYYVTGVGEYSSVSGWKKVFVGLGSARIEYSNGNTYFFHTDHLGTNRVQTDETGAVVETWDSYPFGEQWLQSGGVGNEHCDYGALKSRFEDLGFESLVFGIRDPTFNMGSLEITLEDNYVDIDLDFYNPGFLSSLPHHVGEVIWNALNGGVSDPFAMYTVLKTNMIDPGYDCTIP